MAEYALVGQYKFVDGRGGDVTLKYGKFNVGPKTEVPESVLITPGGEQKVRFIFTTKGRWEYQVEDPKSIEGWQARAFTKGKFTENSEWEDPRTPEELLFRIELSQPPIIFGTLFDQNKNIISNDRVYFTFVQWEVRKDTKGEWLPLKTTTTITDGQIGLDSKDVGEFQKYGEARATILVNGFQDKKITFNPKILSNKTGELPLRILMDRVSKADKKKAIIDGLEKKTTNVINKLK